MVAGSSTPDTITRDAINADVPMSEPSSSRSSTQPITVCYFGTYRATYSRNRIMIDGLRANGVTVVECHEPLWTSIEDRVESVSGGWIKPQFWWRVCRTYGRLTAKFFKLNQPFDLLVVGYPGQFDLFLGRLLAWWRGKPLVWDIFMSIYLIAMERNLDERSQFSVRFLKWVERLGCHLPEQLVLDTEEYARWFEDTYGIPADRFWLVPTGADDSVFSPRELPSPSSDPQGRLASVSDRSFLSRGPTSSSDFVILYYGSYIANHGVLTILEAAKLIPAQASESVEQTQPRIRFVLVGDGPQKADAVQLSLRYRLENVHFVEWLSQSELSQEIESAALCLGSFGETPQSLMTIQNKVYECMAMSRPVLTGDSPAVRQSLQHGKHLYLCPRNDPAGLAKAIVALVSDPVLCETIAAQGHERFLEAFTVQKIGERYRTGLQKTLAEWYGRAE